MIVYSYYCLDILHEGHLLMMRNAKKLAGENGKLIVGILTDNAVMEKKVRPLMSFKERMQIAESLKYPDLIVPQDTYSPLPNVLAIRPDVLMESMSHDANDLAHIKNIANNAGIKVIVLPYYGEQSSTELKNKIIKSKRKGKI